jgi:uncharacterized protein
MPIKQLRVIYLFILFISANAFAEEGNFQQQFQQLWTKQDYPGLLRIAEPLAKSGDPLAQGVLGGMYQRGLGVEKDENEAIYWFELSAQQGLSSSQYYLGTILLAKALAEENDSALAISWLEKAAEQKQGYAEQTLGTIYKYGLGVPVDLQRADFWLRRAEITLKPETEAILKMLREPSSQDKSE